MSDDLQSPVGSSQMHGMMGGGESGHDPHGGYPGGYPGHGQYPHHSPPPSGSPYPQPPNPGYGGPPYGSGGPNGPPPNNNGGPPGGPPGGNGGPYSQPYGYPPHMHAPSQYGYSGYGPPPQGYPPYIRPQQPHESPSPNSTKSRKKSPGRSNEKKTSPQRKSPVSSKPLSDASVSSGVGSGSIMTTEMENARLREMTGGETSEGQQIIEVKPMRSDFHFFLENVASQVRSEAELEVRKTYDKHDEKMKKFLTNTNLNSRLMRAWEDTTQDQRDEYMVKEEDDRQRYIQDDEIASRHCATLTARAKSPKANQGGDGSGEHDQDDETKKRASPVNSIHPDESPTKKSKQMANIAPAKEESDIISVKRESGNNY